MRVGEITVRYIGKIRVSESAFHSPADNSFGKVAVREEIYILIGWIGKHRVRKIAGYKFRSRENLQAEVIRIVRVSRKGKRIALLILVCGTVFFSGKRSPHAALLVYELHAGFALVTRVCIFEIERKLV